MLSNLDELRIKLDQVDQEIILCIVRRFEVIHQIGSYKKSEEIPMMQNDRVNHVRDIYVKGLGSHAISEDFASSLVELIFSESFNIENRIIDGDSRVVVREEDA